MHYDEIDDDEIDDDEMHYDPEIAPNPQEWLELDEQERIMLAEDYHLAADAELPELAAHAIIHAIVENQIAEGVDSVVRAMARLRREGLSRHDAVHAIGCVFAEYYFDVLNMEESDSESAGKSLARYYAAIERLNAKEWLRKYGE